jgi:hypothetical protein
MGECGHDFLSNLIVAFTKKSAPFRMSYDHIAASKISQHGARYFTGEGAMALPVEILGRKTNLGERTQRGANGFQGRKGRGEDQLAIQEVWQPIDELRNERRRLRRRLVHLPVSDDEWCTHSVVEYQRGRYQA